MITSWVISLFLVFLVKFMVGRPSLVPSKGQLIIESVVGGLRGILEPIVGKGFSFLLFWLLVAFSSSLLYKNWSGLLPGVGTIGYGQNIDGHFAVSKPLIRPGNADINMTLALALVANAFWIYFIFKYAGFKAIIKDWFGNKADKKESSLYNVFNFIDNFHCCWFHRNSFHYFQARFIDFPSVWKCFWR